MLIALLAVLGVDLIVIAAVVALVISRRVTSGEVDGLGKKWRRGFGYWVRDVLVWTPGFPTGHP